MFDFSQYNRIVILGSPGSGKSTLARQIAAQTGHPLIHLDYEHWNPGWVATPKEEFRAKQVRWVQGERWIIDGNYGSTMELRYAAADLVVFLDLPRTLCLWRVLRRHGKPRPDMKDGLVDEERLLSKDFREFLAFIWHYPRDGRPKVFALQEQYPQVKLLRLRARGEVSRLMQ